MCSDTYKQCVTPCKVRTSSVPPSLPRIDLEEVSAPHLLSIVGWFLPTRHVICTLHCVPCTMHHALCTVYCVLYAMYFVLCAMQQVLFTVYCEPCAIYFQLCTGHGKRYAGIYVHSARSTPRTVYCVLLTMYNAICSLCFNVYYAACLSFARLADIRWFRNIVRSVLLKCMILGITGKPSKWTLHQIHPWYMIHSWSVATWGFM